MLSDSSHAKVTITDIRKKYDLKKLKVHTNQNITWIYGLAGAVAAILLLIVVLQVLKRMPRSGPRRIEQAPATYIHLNPVSSLASETSSLQSQSTAPGESLILPPATVASSLSKGKGVPRPKAKS